MKLAHCRKLLQDEDALRAPLSPSANYSPDPLQQPINGTAITVVKRSFKHNSPFDSSMALTILALLTALFFMGFFSVYIRRFADEEERRRRHPPPPSSLSLGPHKPKGLDPSTVKSLPLVPYTGAAEHPIDCAICLSEFEEREIVKMIPYCRHEFHPQCIDTWLSSHVSCPVCRSTQLFKVAEVYLSVVEGEKDHGVSEPGRRSAAEESDTQREVSLRRSCSCSSLEDRPSLRRSSSF